MKRKRGFQFQFPCMVSTGLSWIFDGISLDGFTILF